MKNLPVLYTGTPSACVTVERLASLIQQGRPLTITEKLLHFATLYRLMATRRNGEPPTASLPSSANLGYLARHLLDVRAGGAASARAGGVPAKGVIMSSRS